MNDAFPRPFRIAAPIVGAITAALALGACSAPGDPEQPAGAAADGTVTVDNCGRDATYPGAATMLAYDPGIIAIALAAGAADNVTAVANIADGRDTLAAKYGADTVDGLDVIADKAPTLEQIVSVQPDVYFAGWNYGMSEGRGVTPELLDQRGIASYILTESCRQEGSTHRGLVDPWEALETDLRNIGAVSGSPDAADAVIGDTRQRRAVLDAAPGAEKEPTVFLFDSGTDAIFTSGKFGGPQAIIETAGGRNHADAVEDTWVEVGWETLAADAPDAFVFVDYGGQTLQEKIAVLRSHPVTRDLPAVKENRFINLPYAMWVSSPLNIDAAEHVRAGLERFQLLPESGITPELALPASIAGHEYVGG